jgi:flagellar hook-associated protein 2
MGLRIGGITFGGISSGLPTEELIEKLLELERRPVTLLETQKESFQQKLEILQDLNARTRTLRDRLRELDNMNLLGSAPSASEEFKRYTASSSDETVATASVANSAQIGLLPVQVTATAAAQRDVSDQNFAALSTAIGTGNFQITVAGVATDITIDSGNATIEGLIAAINDSGADVTAFALNDGSANPYRIVITGNQTGADQTIAYAIDGGIGVSFATSQSPDDAEIVIDPDGANPIGVSSSTNTFSDVLEGLSIEALQTSASAITIQVARDNDAVAEAIAGVVAAYNDVMTVINEQAQIDLSTNRGGPLLGDSTLLSLQRRLSTVVASSIGSGDVQIAAQLGLEIDREGKLSLDEDELDAAIASGFDDVAAYFSGPSSFADQLRDVADDFVDPVDGFLIARINGTSSSIAELDERIARGEERLDTVEENLVRQFSALESTISGLQLQSSFLSQYILQSLNR